MAGNIHSGRVGRLNNGDKPKNIKETFTRKIPKDLPQESKIYWKAVIPILKERNAIKNADFYVFHRLCVLYHLWRECEKVLLKKGATYESTTDRGGLRVLKRPEADLALRYNAEMTKLERKFGLSDRAKEQNGKPQKQSVRSKY